MGVVIVHGPGLQSGIKERNIVGTGGWREFRESVDYFVGVFVKYEDEVLL